MSTNKLPLNIAFLTLSDQDIKTINQITVLNIFDNTAKNFHPEGLFSTSIFGKVGSEYRSRVFGYIDLKTPILHPMIYSSITKVKAFYDDVMAGKSYAVYNKSTHELDESNAVEGQTGMSFFIQHLPNLKFVENESISRSFNIKIIYKAIQENKHLLSYLLVLPAGLRDYTVEPSGKTEEDEVNKMYRKVLMQSNLIDKTTYKLNPASSDHINYTIQNLVLEIYSYFQGMLEGKHKLILSKWTSRKTFNSTRNVISSNVEEANNVDDPTRLKYNETAVGLYQFLRAISPKSIYEIKTNYITKLFPSSENVAYLTNVKTLKKEQVIIKDVQKDFDSWVSPEGIEGLINKFGNNVLRHNEVTLDNGKYYLGLIYNDGKYFKFIQDIDEVPEGYDRKLVTPITFIEIMYISVYKLNKVIPAYVTRYPIASYGSIYPSWMHVKTTVPSIGLEELNDNWEGSGDVAICFPVKGKPFFDTMSPNPAHLGRLGGDFDGDTVSLQSVVSDEAIAELTEMFGNAKYYVDDQNKMNFSLSTDVLEDVLGYMTR